jgi:hypothetical protein
LDQVNILSLFAYFQEYKDWDYFDL